MVPGRLGRGRCPPAGGTSAPSGGRPTARAPSRCAGGPARRSSARGPTPASAPRPRPPAQELRAAVARPARPRAARARRGPTGRGPPHLPRPRRHRAAAWRSLMSTTRRQLPPACTPAGTSCQQPGLQLRAGCRPVWRWPGSICHVGCAGAQPACWSQSFRGTGGRLACRCGPARNRAPPQARWWPGPGQRRAPGLEPAAEQEWGPEDSCAERAHRAGGPRAARVATRPPRPCASAALHRGAWAHPCQRAGRRVPARPDPQRSLSSPSRRRCAAPPRWHRCHQALLRHPRMSALEPSLPGHHPGRAPFVTIA